MTTDPAPSDVSPDPPRSEPSPAAGAAACPPPSGRAGTTSGSSTCACATSGCGSGAPGAASPAAPARARGRRACASGRTSGSPTSGSRPDGVPGIAIPFYLAHPRLRRLEQTPDAGGRGRHAPSGACGSCATRRVTRSTTPTSCAAPKRRQQLFGRRSKPYPEYYDAAALQQELRRRTSTPWYAQSHPDEDFAETFAVWLTPRLELARSATPAGGR